MKKLVCVLLLLATVSCGDSLVFPKYKSVIEMLEASGDYTGHNLEEIPNNDGITHVRVSSEFLKVENLKVINQQVKRDIVYVVFQTFAQTDLDNISITATPIIRTSFNPNLEYDGKLLETLSETVNVSRAKAEELLKKYLNNSSFEDLYDVEGTLYLPNDNFDKLKYDELNNVFLDLKK